VDEGEARIRQFEVLWAEIARRSNAQQALVAATVTATGTLAGLAVTDKADPVVLVVLAVVAPTFGLLWLDHARNIGEIGNFIRCNWGSDWGPNWEQLYAEGKNTREGRFRFAIFITAVILVFVGPAFGGLVASVCQLDGQLLFIAAWGGAALLTTLFAISLGIQIVQTRPGPPEPCSGSASASGPSSSGRV
jgi:hypothetical protein